MVIPPQHLANLGYSPESLDCAGLKLTLCEVFLPSGPGEVRLEGKSVPSYERITPTDGRVYRLPEGAYIIRYCEYVKIPEDFMAVALPRSTLIRSGATLFSAVWDPGYEGRGYGLLLVLNKYGMSLEVGAQVAQLVYMKLGEKTAQPYRGTYYLEK
jgi:dUTP pyrophosphatase